MVRCTIPSREKCYRRSKKAERKERCPKRNWTGNMYVKIVMAKIAIMI